jgi:hypothetical protein
MDSMSPAAMTGTTPSPSIAPNPGVIPPYSQVSLQTNSLEDSQTQEQTMPSDLTQPDLGKGKRKHSGGHVHEDPRPLKKLKYSVARDPVELEG